MDILLVTGQNPFLGRGHFQRMLSLLKYLNNNGHRAYIFATEYNASGLAPKEFKAFIINELPREADLILRDKRDSTEDEIQTLQQVAPVAVIDDRGPGREKANMVIDLLPHPQHEFNREFYHPEAFIYGYEFASSIDTIDKAALHKDISFFMYGGFSPERDHVHHLLEMVPKELEGLMLADGKYMQIKNAKLADEINKPYAELILSAQVAVSHFGITLYEAHLGDASLIALNTSQYHHKLCECAKELNITHSCVLETAETEVIQNTIRQAANKYPPADVKIEDIQKKLELNMTNFMKLITG